MDKAEDRVKNIQMDSFLLINESIRYNNSHGKNLQTLRNQTSPIHNTFRNRYIF